MSTYTSNVDGLSYTAHPLAKVTTNSYGECALFFKNDVINPFVQTKDWYATNLPTNDGYIVWPIGEKYDVGVYIDAASFSEQFSLL